MERLRQQLSDANADINQTNKSFEILKKEVEEGEKEKPKLKNYYTPSKEMKKYQSVAFILTGLTGGVIIDKIFFFQRE